MFGPEREQLRHDFKTAPRLVDLYFNDEDREDALTMVRQVNGVSTYLSWMATGEPRIFEGTVFAVGIAGMDVITDERNESVSEWKVEAALENTPPEPELRPLSSASDIARGPGFDDAVLNIAQWQDYSLEQFGSPTQERLHEITRGKGGYSALAHLHALKESPTREEKTFMLPFGETMQLLDDYLDQPHDESDGIATLFTEGYMDGDDLLDSIQRVERHSRDVWGDTRAVRRFGRVMRAHRRLGQLENRWPGAASRVLPWYF